MVALNEIHPLQPCARELTLLEILQHAKLCIEVTVSIAGSRADSDRRTALVEAKHAARLFCLPA